jgi:xanthine dehydrogenase molybdenum-binding subunit
MDPLEFRLKNYTTYQSVGTDEGSDSSAAVRSNEEKIPYSSKTLDQCMEIATDAIGWEKTKKDSSSFSEDAKKRGIGMASYLVMQGVGLFPYKAEADVEITSDGTINLYIGVVDIGGGQETIFSMIAAEELGVDAEDITVVMGDTKNTRYGPSCHASRCTAEMAPAVLQAASEAREKLFELTSPILDSPVELLQSKRGKIYVETLPSMSLDFREACKKIDPEKSIRGSGSRAPNPKAPMMATFGAQAVDLEVDTETGEVNILKIAAAHDFGRAINPKLCVSQVHGGIEFGVGFALSEEGVYDPKSGILLSNNFYHYRMPTSLDFPAVDAMIAEVEDPYFAYSAKGAGENTNAPTPAAIRNAIYDAIGIWFNDLPITPDKIIDAIRKQRAE